MIATGPLTSRCMRSSGMVMRPARACRLPKQLGPETASPVCAITALSRADKARAPGSRDSPKPAVSTVALRAPARLASISASGTKAAGMTTTTWSGGSGSSA